MLPGDVVLPRPSWVSYAAQAALAGKRVIDVPIAEQAGGVPDPDALRAALQTARRDGPNRRSSSSPCPTTPPARSRPRRSSRRCATWPAEHGLLVVCDEIYRDLAHEPEALLSPATLLPESVFVTGESRDQTPEAKIRCRFDDKR